MLRDLGSTNGVLLAGHRVDRFTLHAGSVFQVGETRLLFSASGDRLLVPVSPMEQFGELYGRSLAMRRVFAQLERVAPLELTVLVTGETGTGKELVARSLHQMSLRAERPYLVLDCSVDCYECGSACATRACQGGVDCESSCSCSVLCNYCDASCPLSCATDECTNGEICGSCP